MAQKYWLMKSEPNVFSIDDLKKVKREPWDGVRNYQARNFMRDEMQVGDEILFYHSNSNPPGVAGLARVSKEAFADFTAWDPKSPYYDPKSSPDNPRWMMVEVEFVGKFRNFVSLEQLKEQRGPEGMRLLQKGNRLSVMPVAKREYDLIASLGE